MRGTWYWAPPVEAPNSVRLTSVGLPRFSMFAAFDETIDGGTTWCRSYFYTEHAFDEALPGECPMTTGEKFAIRFRRHASACGRKTPELLTVFFFALADPPPGRWWELFEALQAPRGGQAPVIYPLVRKCGSDVFEENYCGIRTGLGKPQGVE